MKEPSKAPGILEAIRRDPAFALKLAAYAVASLQMIILIIDLADRLNRDSLVISGASIWELFFSRLFSALLWGSVLYGLSVIVQRIDSFNADVDDVNDIHEGTVVDDAVDS